jgi:hypothetical protein
MNRIGRYILPYCLQQTTSGRYVVLNRQYKPLGYTEGWFEYDDYSEDLLDVQEFTPRLRWSDSDNASIHLYTDAQDPTLSTHNWSSYRPRLKLLRQLGARLPARLEKAAGVCKFQVTAEDGSSIGLPFRLSRQIRPCDVLERFIKYKIPL